MFERKLTALEYHSPNDFDYNDEKVFRNFVSWLENQKIRLYKVEDRTDLDNIDDPNWPSTYEKYLNDLQSPMLNSKVDRQTQIEQLLSQAIRFEYSDNIDKYNSFNSETEFMRSNSNSGQNADNPLENIDFNSPEFVEGLHKMQRLLNIPSKQNDVATVLQAISHLISDKLNADSVRDALNSASVKDNAKESGVEFMMNTIDAGINTNDQLINEATKILRLLHIKELRDLQTKINETIVALQTITANPKTDSSLGKVGK